MVKLTNPSKIEKWYHGWDESMIWSYFQNVMGNAYVDQRETPSSAIVYVNCFGFVAGKPNVQLIKDFYSCVLEDFAILVVRDDSWHSVFEEVGKDKCRRVERYATKKEPNCFNVNNLTVFVNQVEHKYHLKSVDKDLYYECKKHRWSADLVCGYKDYDEYKSKGIGFVALYDNQVVAGASSYSTYADGIEVEVDTKEAFRRKGLATACASKLIIECIEKGLYPSWDAQNKWSLSLAEKLGYHFSHSYCAYEFWK